MIDIHTHIIPGVDDGSPSLDESLKMLQAARADGINALVATPHVCHSRGYISFDEKQHADYRLKLEQLKYRAKEQLIDIEILTGAEVFFVTDLREKLHEMREAFTINNSDYFLLEFPPDVVFPGSKEYIFDLVTEGLIPIICHPERNLVFRQNLQLLYRIIQAGALVQIDVGSIRGDFGPTAYSAAMNLLKYNMAQVIASDCHNLKSQPPGLSCLYTKLPEIEKERIDMLVKSTPQAIVNNNAVPDCGPITDPGKKTTFFDFLRGVIK